MHLSDGQAWCDSRRLILLQPAYEALNTNDLNTSTNSKHASVLRMTWKFLSWVRGGTVSKQIGSEERTKATIQQRSHGHQSNPLHPRPRKIQSTPLQSWTCSFRSNPGDYDVNVAIQIGIPVTQPQPVSPLFVFHLSLRNSIFPLFNMRCRQC
jgi:hypothetical protein